MTRNAPEFLKIPQNVPKYVLQDYRGISGRASLPPIAKALAEVIDLRIARNQE